MLMNANHKEYEQMEFDLNEDFFNDPEVAALLQAQAAANGCDSEELKEAVIEMHNMPRWFDPNPIKNIDGFSELIGSVPWDDIEAVRVRMIEEDPSKANLTKEDVFVQILNDQVEREIALLPEKERLEGLFAKAIEAQSSRSSNLKTAVPLLLRILVILFLCGLILSLLPRFISI